MKPMNLLVLFFCAGCNVVDAPETLEDLVGFGFLHFADDFAAEAPTGLVPMTSEFEAELIEGYRVSEMSHEQLAEAGIEAEQRNPIVGVSAIVGMGSTLDEFAFAWSYPRMQDMLEGTIDFRIDAEDGDLDCFLAHECDYYAYDAWRHNDLGFLGTSAQEFRREYLWVTLEDEAGTEVLMTRDLVPQPAEMTGGLFRVDQQYSYTMVFESQGSLTRMDTFWVDAEVIGMDLPDYFALDTAVNNMQKTAEQVDAFVAAQ